MVEEVPAVEDEGGLLHRGVDALEVETRELVPLREHEHRVSALHGHVPASGLGRRSAASAGPLDGWRLASKGWGRCPG